MMMPAAGTPLDRVLAQLHRVKQHGGYWMAQCPAHEDHNPSLSISVGDDGRVLLKCQGGCDTDRVVAAIGLKLADLFPPRAPTELRRIRESYHYVDEHDELLYEVVRYDPKDFRQRRPDGHGGWEWKLTGTRRVLYHLPDVLEAIRTARRIYIAEGEKDVDALRRAGEVATCNAGGAGKWNDDYTRQLAGAREIIIVADRDEPGLQHANGVANRLAVHRAKIRIVQSAEGKDAYDHLAAGHKPDQFIDVPLAEEIAAANNAEDLPSPSIELIEVDWHQAWERRTDQVDWLAEPAIPLGVQILLYAPKKTGKSLVVLEWAAALASGRPVLNQPAGDPLDILIVDFENTVEDDIVPRLEDYGYTPDDLTHLHLYSFPPIKPLDTDEGARRLEELILRHFPALVILDSFQRIVGGPENDADTIRAYYRHTGFMLKRHKVTSIRLDNSGKDETAGPRGSSSKGDDVDLIWRLKRVENGLRLTRDAQRGTLAPEEINLQRVETPHLHHRVVDDSWPAGTKGAIALIDRIGIPRNASRREARALLKTAGETLGTEALGAALRYRKTSGPPNGPTDSPTFGQQSGPQRTTLSDQGGPSHGPPWTTFPGDGGPRGVSQDTPVHAPTEPDPLDELGDDF